MKKVFILVLSIIFGLSVFASQINFSADSLAQGVIVRTDKIPKTFTLSGLTVNRAPRSSAYIIFSKGKPVGIFFRKVKVTYIFKDKYFLPLAKRNFKSLVKGKFKTTNNTLVFKAKAKYVAIWDLKLAQKFIPEKMETGETLPKNLQNIIKNLTSYSPVSSLILQKLQPGKGYFSCYIKTSRDEFIYEKNPFGESEGLSYLSLYPFKFKNIRNLYQKSLLTKKTLKKSWLEKEQPSLRVVETVFNIENNKKEHIKVKTTQKIKILKNGTNTFKASLISQIYGRKKVRKYSVLSVKLNGKPVDFYRDKTFFIVDFRKKYNKGSFITLETITEGDIAIRKNGDQRWILNEWGWYPKPRLCEESSTYRFFVKTHKPLIPFVSGEIIKRHEDKNYNYLEAVLNTPAQFPSVTAGVFKTCFAEVNGITCTAACYAMEKEAIARKFMNIFFSSIKFYSDVFKIPYPYKQQFLVEEEIYGMSSPAIIFFSRNRTKLSPYPENINYLAPYPRWYKNNRKPRPAQKLKTGNFQAFAHEISHSYWGNLTQVPNEEEKWISEALCQVSSLFCITSIEPDRKEAMEFYNITLKRWKNQMAYTSKGSILYFADFFTFSSPQDYGDKKRLLYAKGPYIFLELKKELEKEYGKQKGNAIFTVFLRDILKQFQHKYLYTIDLINTLNKLTKKDWTEWFKRYVLTEELP